MGKKLTLQQLKARSKLESWFRARFARAVNTTPGVVWIPEANTGRGYTPGRPDGMVGGNGKVVFVELKAAYGTVKMGDDDLGRTAGWHGRQRNWWRNVSKPYGFPYFIALFAAPKTAVYPQEATLFLATPQDWFLAQERIGKKSCQFDAFRGAYEGLLYPFSSLDRAVYHLKEVVK